MEDYIFKLIERIYVQEHYLLWQFNIKAKYGLNVDFNLLKN